MVVMQNADTKFTRRYSPVMAQAAIDKILPGPKLDALTAEKVFGWRKVHKREGSLVGRKQDKAGHWRRAKVPNYSTNPASLIFGREPDETTWPNGSIPKTNSLRSLVPKTFRPIGLRRINAAGRRSELLDNTARSSR